MNLILVTAIIFTVAIVHGEPCQDMSNKSEHNAFVCRHILQEKFDRKSTKEWKRYLVNRGLCGRVPMQTFIDTKEQVVNAICSGVGRRVQGDTGNLCISKSRMTVYHVQSVNYSNDCAVNNLIPDKQNVIVACNNVGESCLPVHYESYNNQSPSNMPCV